MEIASVLLVFLSACGLRHRWIEIDDELTQFIVVGSGACLAVFIAATLAVKVLLNV